MLNLRNCIVCFCMYYVRSYCFWNQTKYIFLSAICRNPLLIFPWRCSTTRTTASTFLRFLYHTQRRISVDRTPLDELSARRRDLYLTTHNTHNRQTSMSPVGFGPTIPAGERPQTHALGRAATGTGNSLFLPHIILLNFKNILQNS